MDRNTRIFLFCLISILNPPNELHTRRSICIACQGDWVPIVRNKKSLNQQKSFEMNMIVAYFVSSNQIDNNELIIGKIEPSDVMVNQNEKFIREKEKKLCRYFCFVTIHSTTIEKRVFIHFCHGSYFRCHFLFVFCNWFVYLSNTLSLEQSGFTFFF